MTSDVFLFLTSPSQSEHTIKNDLCRKSRSVYRFRYRLGVKSSKFGMEATSSSSSSSSNISFYDFLDRMRNPASLDLVRSIKSFIVSFSFHAPNPDYDGKRVQDFFLTMEAAIRDHPLWAAASDDDIDCALEGLEKYIMTKLFSRTFASTPEDSNIDKEIAEKISLLQTFLKPEHLDIPAILRNEGSWLLAEKELQKMNAFKAPREKLSCIMSCCRIINNLLLNASMSENHVLAGADDFLPVLIYVTIKANPLQLHSNLKFIQLYRRQVKLVSEAAYYFTNLLSAKSFILDLNAKSLSIDEIEFEESMQAARLANKLNHEEPTGAVEDATAMGRPTCPVPSASIGSRNRNFGRSSFPFMEVEAGELTTGDVEKLLRMYKDLVMKYTNLLEAFKHLTSLKGDPPHLEGNTDLFVAHADTKQNDQ